MSIQRTVLHATQCDGCGVVHHDSANSAYAARITAGVAGWAFMKCPIRPDVRQKRNYDFCPDCIRAGKGVPA